MKALVKTRPAWGLELLDVPEPVPAQGEVLLAVAAAPVCGSDVARYTWSVNYGAGQPKDMTRDLPRVLGHEFSGTVLEVAGETGGRLREGDEVVVQNVLGCGRCTHCAAGFTNVCDDRRTIGVHTDGGFAERVAVPAANCWSLPLGVDLRTAAAMQPFAVATHAVAQAQPLPGAAMAVWGLGPIGLAVCLAARIRGVQVVRAFDLDPQRVAEAVAAGVPAVVAGPGTDPLAMLGPRAVDVLVDAAGALPSVLPALPALRKRGTLVMLGNVKGDVPLSATRVVMDEQRLVGSRSYSLASWRTALRTLAASGFPPAADDEVTLDDAIERFEVAAAGRGRPFSVIPG